jgi:type III HopA1-like effector protein
MPAIDDRIRDMLRRVRLTSPDTVRIGERDHHGLRDCLFPWLQCEIYKNFFCHMRAVSAPASLPLQARALAAANAGFGTVQPGWYMAHGQPEPAGTKWLRLYWHVNPRGALVLMGIATGILTRLLAPFRLKILMDTSIDRRDAAVLYLPLSHWIIARDLVGPVSRQLDDMGALDSTTPLFTKLLRPGVGLAEDPQTGLSFGMHRSGLVARSLMRSYLAGHAEEEQQWSSLSAEFAREGLSLDRPYLNAASRDVYEY